MFKTSNKIRDLHNFFSHKQGGDCDEGMKMHATVLKLF